MNTARLSLLTGILLAWTVDLRGDDATNAADEATLKSAGVKTDGPSLLEFFRRRTLSDAEQARLVDTVRLLGDGSFSVREKASADLLAAGRSALPFLRPAVKDPDLEIALRARRCLEAIEGGSTTAQSLAAARLLAVRKPDGAAAVLLNYFPMADDEVVEDELLNTLTVVGARDGKADPALLAALYDKKAMRRGAAVWVLGRLPANQRPAEVRKVLADADARVRLRAAQGLIAGKERDAIPTLVALLADSPLPIAWAAEDLLCRIAGENTPTIALGTGQEAERARCRDAWADWYRKHEAKLDLAKLDLDHRLIGLTLICAANGYNGDKGKVWEVGPDGKTRWEINDVQYPVDAQVLAGNRVLIAEQSGRRVTERDLQGKILWQHPVTENLVGCQRLPNGNTFIATNSQLYEVARDGKVAFRYSGHQSTVYSAVRLRNGNVAYMGSHYKLVELDLQGREVKSFPIDFSGIGLVKPEPQPGGRFLVGQKNNLIELNDVGKPVWEASVPKISCAMRLPNGNILAASIIDRRLVELDRTGKVIWEERLQGCPMRIRRR
jgi:hypothetical protein